MRPWEVVPDRAPVAEAVLEFVRIEPVAGNALDTGRGAGRTRAVRGAGGGAHGPGLGEAVADASRSRRDELVLGS